MDPKAVPDFYIGKARKTPRELATQDVAALFLAKNLQMLTGDPSKIHETMEIISEHPARLIAVTAIMLNVVGGLAAQSPGGMAGLSQYFMNEAAYG